MQTIVLASGNTGKLEELQSLLRPLDIELKPQAALAVNEIEETGLSFVENAILKARHACSVTGLPALSDDSGLEVDALHGAPGIYSARFSGPKADACSNNAKLIRELHDIPPEKRSARFQCVIALMRHAEDPTPLICHGSWDGYILTEPRGTQGHGYDPIFYVPSHNCSAAQLDPMEKNRLSHRGKAIADLLRHFRREAVPVHG